MHGYEAESTRAAGGRASRPELCESDDVALFRRWAEGDRRAGAQLFERHIATVTRFFANKVPDAADLIQGTFLACLEQPHRFEERSSFRTYLLSIARFKLYRHYRTHGLESKRCEFKSTLHGGGSRPSPLTLIARREGDETLLRALRMIPLDLQTLLELAYWEDVSGQELAELFEIPLNTVYTRLHRAKQKLRDALKLLEDPT